MATLLGSISSLYDKYLLARFDRMLIQAWFSIYMVPVMGIALLTLWYPRRKTSSPFQWRWSIPCIGLLLSVADFFYFYALSDKDSLITVLSTIRRGSVVYSFFIGAWLFREKNILHKALILTGILAGIVLLIFSSH